MLSKRLEKAINDQIGAELYSSYLYMAMGAYAESLNLGGFANWMMKQSQEELGHAMKFWGFVHDRGGRVELQALDKPPADFGGPLTMFQETLKHEQLVTSLINDLYALAIEEKDYASEIFLQWFVTEQVEEEESAEDVIDVLESVGEKGHALFMADRHLAAR